jgi:hypothetical protein
VFGYILLLQQSLLIKLYFFLRHSVATMTRKHCGSLEIVQAVTGHKDQKLVQHYAQFAPSNHQKLAVEKLVNKSNWHNQTKKPPILNKKKPCKNRAFLKNMVLPRGFEPLLPP